jgi:hypothetical protein
LSVGGAALDFTDVGALLGVPPNVISAADVTAGIGLAGAGMNDILHDAAGPDPRMDAAKWVQKNVAGKLDSYVRARAYLPGYENASLGLDFTQPGATSEFKATVEEAVEQWKAANPGVPVTVRWAP